MIKSLILSLTLTIIILSAPTTIYALTPYQSGYKHGVTDGKIERITEGNHTVQYDQGYIDGWCSLPDHRGRGYLMIGP